jgi:hypothetical protein
MMVFAIDRRTRQFNGGIDYGAQRHAVFTDLQRAACYA